MLFGHQDGGVWVQLISQHFVSLQFISEQVQEYFFRKPKALWKLIRTCDFH